jgi:tetratricopeptide (TPR) repeat protein
MRESGKHERLAQDSFDRAVYQHELGQLDAAIELMREAAVLYAASDSAAVQESDARVLSRAMACRLCGDYLVEDEQYAEAANIYQEAVDQYSRLNSEEAEVDARRCARKLLDCIALLRARPFDRLNLLIAQYEHKQRQYAAQPEQEAQQAECAAHIARILARRERYEQSVERYREALDLYERAGGEPEVQLAIAECHHRMAGLLAYRLNKKLDALAHYHKAVVLYAEHEPYVYGSQQARELCERAVSELT